MSNERLFIELYLDEDVSVLLADLLKSRGYTVFTTREAKMLGKSYDEQLAYAVSQQKTFLLIIEWILRTSTLSISKREDIITVLSLLLKGTNILF